MIGSTISRYQILERLGGGGMGVVYKAKDLMLDRWVALKFLSTERGGGTSEENRRRFLREAKAASALDHSNICAVFDIGEGEDGRLYIAMAYCAGETLKSRIARGSLSPTEAADIAAQIADGLAEAHNKGITHRDIKPANVIVGEGGRIKLVDFGLAGFADQTRLTRPGIAIGTASYMSPEQCRGEAADPATDIWALGVVLYEMLAGHLPFQGDRPEQVIKTILRRRPDPIPNLPPELARIVFRALEKDPLDRYPNAEAFGADLQSFRQSHDPRWDQTLTDVSMSPLWNPRGTAGESEAGSGVGLVGKTISHYRIGQPLGGGGMGIVYRAEDLRLERTVALKFLPPELSWDPDAKERFLKEARAASSLDHPNVCTIHEVGETEDGRLFLAMPCYLGETLRDRIARGPLPLEEALDYARQIARGLVKAHRSGIVHRDIKPANLLVTEDGVVKILDFGLAKLAGAVALTRAGSSIGTPSYMSPEQARGGEVDPRTDLWSLGVILYEMVSGRRPFRGEHEQAIVYALLNETPEPVASLVAGAPEGLSRLVERLLAKDREARPASADEVLTDLKVLSGITLAATGMQTAASSIGPSGAGMAATSVGPPRRAGRSARGGRWLAGLAVLAFLGGAVWLVLLALGSRLPRVNFQALTDQGGRALFPSLAPDGNVVVYTLEDGGDLDIFLQAATGDGRINLTRESPANDSQPAYSPNGTQIAFRSEREGGGIFLMGVTGGEPRRLTEFGYNPAWSPDGTALVVATEPVTNPAARYSKSELYRVALGGSGERKRITQGDAVQPSWSPNGRRIAYWGIVEGTTQRALWTVPAEGGEPRLAFRDEHLSWNPVWSPDGRYLYFVSNRGGSMNLWRLRIDEASGEVRGEPDALTTPAPSIGFLSLAKDGRRIAFAIDDSRNTLRRTTFDPAALEASPDLTMVVRSARGVRSAEVSPDGRYVAFHTGGPREDLALIDLKDSTQRELTSDEARDRHPHWSPDGRLLVFNSDRGQGVEIWTIRPDGSGLARAVPASGGEPNTFPLWSPDGRRLLWTRGEGNPMLLDLSVPAEARKPIPLPRAAGTQDRFAPYSWSADGEWLAGDLFPAGKARRPGLYSFRTGTFSALAERGNSPVFLRDGRHVLYLDEGRVFAVDRQTLAPRLVLAPPPSSSFSSLTLDPQNRTLYLVSRDDQGEIGMVRFE